MWISLDLSYFRLTWLLESVHLCISPNLKVFSHYFFKILFQSQFFSSTSEMLMIQISKFFVYFFFFVQVNSIDLSLSSLILSYHHHSTTKLIWWLFICYYCLFKFYFLHSVLFYDFYFFVGIVYFLCVSRKSVTVCWNIFIMIA